MRLLLVRHGESEWNALGRWQGQADPPLSARGRAQAAAAVVALAPLQPHAIVASTLERATQTALIFSEHLGVGPILLDHGLIERDAGEWSGLTRHEIEARFPGYLAGGRRPPGYEDDRAVLARTLAAVGRIVERCGQFDVVVAVAHGGIIYALEAHLGAEFTRKPNLGARFFYCDGDTIKLGESVDLLDASAATTPDLL